MNIIGKWKIVKIMRRDDNDNIVRLDEEEYKNTPMYEPDEPSDFGRVYKFDADGTARLLIPVPEGMEEEMKAAAASGRFQIIDGMLFRGEPLHWSERDGKIFCDIPGAGETELKYADGLLELMAYCLEKIG